MEEQQMPPCTHRWVLGEPRRGTIKGVCRRCGARRTYPSGLELPEAPPEAEEMDVRLPLLVAAASFAEEDA